MKSIFTLSLFACLLVPLTSQAQSFSIATDSTGKAYLILEDGTITYKHPALRRIRKDRYLNSLEEPEVLLDQEALPWQAYAEKGRKQMTASRLCYAGAILLPVGMGIRMATDDPVTAINRLHVGIGAGVLLGLIGLGLEAAAHKNYNHSIHLHLDAQGVGIGIPLE